MEGSHAEIPGEGAEGRGRQAWHAGRRQPCGGGAGPPTPEMTPCTDMPPRLPWCLQGHSAKINQGRPGPLSTRRDPGGDRSVWQPHREPAGAVLSRVSLGTVGSLSSPCGGGCGTTEGEREGHCKGVK